MLLAIDIGNTNTDLGIFDGEEFRATWHVATDIHRRADEYFALLLNLLRNHGLNPSDIKEVIMCSVVPPLTVTFEELLERHFHIQCLLKIPLSLCGF